MQFLGPGSLVFHYCLTCIFKNNFLLLVWVLVVKLLHTYKQHMHQHCLCIRCSVDTGSCHSVLRDKIPEHPKTSNDEVGRLTAVVGRSDFTSLLVRRSHG